jgi:hypothetical protein
MTHQRQRRASGLVWRWTADASAVGLRGRHTRTPQRTRRNVEAVNADAPGGQQKTHGLVVTEKVEV